MGYLTLKNAEDIFRKGICLCLGLDPTSPSSYSKVRISWPQLGQPGWNQSDEVSFLRVFEVDDPYNRQRDITYQRTNSDHASKQIAQTRVWQIQVISYGPSSYDHQAVIRNRLFSEEVKKFFRVSSLFLLPDFAAPRRIPELYNGNWWDRSDMTIRFNEKVIYEPEDVPYIDSVEISLASQTSTGNSNKNKDSAGSTSTTKITNTEMESRAPEGEKEDKEIARGENIGIKIIKS